MVGNRRTGTQDEGGGFAILFPSDGLTGPQEVPAGGFKGKRLVDPGGRHVDEDERRDV